MQQPQPQPQVLKTLSLHIPGTDVTRQVHLPDTASVEDVKAEASLLLQGRRARVIGLPRGNEGSKLGELKLKAPHRLLCVLSPGGQARLDEPAAEDVLMVGVATAGPSPAARALAAAEARSKLGADKATSAYPDELEDASVRVSRPAGERHKRMETATIASLLLRQTQAKGASALYLDPAHACALSQHDEFPVWWNNARDFAARVALRVANYRGYVRLAPLDPTKKTLVLDLDSTLMDTRFFSSLCPPSVPNPAGPAAAAAAACTQRKVSCWWSSEQGKQPPQQEPAPTPSAWRRPLLHEFLAAVYPYYNLVVWSATGNTHVQSKLKDLGMLDHPAYKLGVLIDYGAMIRVKVKKGLLERDFNTKPLSVLYNLFGSEGNLTPHTTLILDDHRRSFVMDPSQGVHVLGYRADSDRVLDTELADLARYLLLLRHLPSVRLVDHLGWREVARAPDPIQALAYKLRPGFTLHVRRRKDLPPGPYLAAPTSTVQAYPGSATLQTIADPLPAQLKLTVRRSGHRKDLSDGDGSLQGLGSSSASSSSAASGRNGQQPPTAAAAVGLVSIPPAAAASIQPEPSAPVRCLQEMQEALQDDGDELSSLLSNLEGEAYAGSEATERGVSPAAIHRQHSMQRGERGSPEPMQEEDDTWAAARQPGLRTPVSYTASPAHSSSGGRGTPRLRMPSPDAMLRRFQGSPLRAPVLRAPPAVLRRQDTLTPSLAPASVQVGGAGSRWTTTRGPGVLTGSGVGPAAASPAPATAARMLHGYGSDPGADKDVRMVLEPQDGPAAFASAQPVAAPTAQEGGGLTQGAEASSGEPSMWALPGMRGRLDTVHDSSQEGMVSPEFEVSTPAATSGDGDVQPAGIGTAESSSLGGQHQQDIPQLEQEQGDGAQRPRQGFRVLLRRLMGRPKG